MGSDNSYIIRFGLPYIVGLLGYKLGITKSIPTWGQLSKQRFFERMDPADYSAELCRWYRRTCQKELNLENPRTFTEKIQWMKLHDNTSIKTTLADKFLVRDWINEKIGQDYLIPILGAWDKAEDIDFDALPDKFVLKCNHGCAMNIIVADKKKLDQKQTRKQLNNWLKINYAFATGDFQLQYKDIPPKIVAEEFLSDSESEGLRDYKFFCFNGKPLFCQVIADRYNGETIDFYDMNWNHQDFVGLAPCPNSETGCEQPKNFADMKRISEILSAGFSFVRVDLYEVNGKIYFGEMTFTPGSGAGCFTPESANDMLGELIDLTYCNEGKSGGA